MEKINQVLSFIFYLIWIPLGLVLLAAVLYMLMANPFGRMMGSFPGGGPGGQPSGFNPRPPGGQDSPPGGFPDQPDNFGPPSNSGPSRQ